MQVTHRRLHEELLRGTGGVYVDKAMVFVDDFNYLFGDLLNTGCGTDVLT